MQNVYTLTNHDTMKNYIQSFNPQTGYMKFTTEKTAAAKMKKPEAIKLKKLLDHNKMFATIELA